MSAFEDSWNRRALTSEETMSRDQLEEYLGITDKPFDVIENGSYKQQQEWMRKKESDNLTLRVENARLKKELEERDQAAAAAPAAGGKVVAVATQLMDPSNAEAMDRDVADLTTKLEEAQRELHDRNELHRLYSEQMEDLRELEDREDELRHQLVEYVERNQALEDQLSSVLNDRDDACAMYSQKERELQDIHVQYDQLKREFEVQAENYVVIHEQLDKARAERDDARAQCSEREREAEQTKIEHIQLTQQLTDQVQHSQALQEQLKGISSERDEIQSRLAEKDEQVEHAKRLEEQLRTELKEQMEWNKATQDQLKEVSCKRDEAAKICSSKDDEIESLISRASEYTMKQEEQAKEIESLRDQLQCALAAQDNARALSLAKEEDLDQSESELNNVKHQLAEETDSRLSLQGQLDSALATVEKFQTQWSTSTERLEKAENDHEQLERELVAKAKVIENLQKLRDDALFEQENLKGQLSEHMNNHESAQHQLQTALAANDDAFALSIRRGEEREQTLVKELAGFQERDIDIGAALSAKDAAIAAARIECKLIEDNCAELRHRNEELQVELQDIQIQLQGERDMYARALDQERQRAEEMNERLLDARKENDELQVLRAAELEAADLQAKEMQEKLTQLEKHCCRLSAQAQEMSTDATAQQEYIARLKERVSTLESEAQSLCAENAGLRAKLEELTDVVQDDSSGHPTGNEVSRDSKIQQLQQALDEKEELFSSMEDALATQKERCEELHDKVAEAEATIQAMQDSLDAQHDLAWETEKEKQHEISILRASLEEKVDQYGGLSKKHEESENRVFCLERTLASLQADLSSSEESRFTLESELSRARARVQELLSSAQDAAMASQVVGTLTQKLLAEEAASRRLQSDLDKLTKRLSESQDARTSLPSQPAELPTSMDEPWKSILAALSRRVDEVEVSMGQEYWAVLALRQMESHAYEYFEVLRAAVVRINEMLDKHAARQLSHGTKAKKGSRKVHRPRALQHQPENQSENHPDKLHVSAGNWSAIM
ncbi:hypothetical protein FVE85_3640 [Porphyridium purpureum]|uniref:Uncharacterized protein n=1 Tax=Porphyridium purpureum TaxID=35688 RepID=A0A5J4YMF1_PORPP|nr:hypothetical protein FVE85_3640 [Porphyridium purpureum]|eukprot:POR5878..scf249_10